MGLSKRTYLGILAALLLLVASGCSTSRNYERAYRRAWRKIVNSQAWLDALAYNTKPGTTRANGIYSLPAALNEERPEEHEGILVDEEFLETYKSLVFRAYFRTITEAEKADARIYETYRKLKDQRQLGNNRQDPEYTEALSRAKDRYQAHRGMLEGLKSWKAFNKYGSNDLEFFMNEYLSAAFTMHRKGSSDEAIIEFLQYRLADLYHFEERNSN